MDCQRAQVLHRSSSYKDKILGRIMQKELFQQQIEERLLKMNILKY